MYRFRDRSQIATNELVALGLGNPSVSVPCNRERTRPGSHTHMIEVIGLALVDQLNEG